MSSFLVKNGLPLLYEYNPITYEIPTLEILKFYTSASTNTFDPVFGVSSGVLQWDLADGSIVNANSFSHTYSLSGNKRVRLYSGTTSGALDITSIQMGVEGMSSNLAGTLDLGSLINLTDLNIAESLNLTNIINPISSQNFTKYAIVSCGLTGALDVSGLTGLGGEFKVYNNLNLTQILNPASSQLFSTYYAYDCNLTGTLDISGLIGLGGGFGVNNNPNLTQILNPISSQTFGYYSAANCNLTGTLDISCLTGLGEDFEVSYNPNLTQILNPVSSEIFEYYYADYCNLTGVLDVSGLSGLGGEFIVNNNPNLTKILNPVSSEIFQYYVAINCNLTGTLDISCLTGLGEDFEVSYNPNLTRILNPVSSESFYAYYANDCNLTGTLDVSGLTGLGGVFNVGNNINLLNINLSVLSNSVYLFNAKNCSLNISTVDDIFVKLNNWYQVNIPTQQLVIDLGGGGNSWPTNGWSNTELVALQTRFANLHRDVSITINTPPEEAMILKFTTNASTNTFDPEFGVLSGVLQWDLADGSIVNANSFSHTYSLLGNKLVEVYSGTTEGALDITSLKIGSKSIPSDLVGIFDISSLENLSYMELTGSTNLTQIINPVSSRVFTLYAIITCNITGTLDVSGLTGLGGVFAIQDNPNLTQILNPVSSEILTTYFVGGCTNLTGTLDVSGLTGLGGDLEIFDSPNLTQILNPSSSQIFTTYGINNCNLTGTLDVSGLTGLGGEFNVVNNINLLNIDLPTLTQEFSEFNAKNCSLNISTVDDIFVKLNNWYQVNIPTQQLVIDLGGGGNSWPTNGWSNTELVALQTEFANWSIDISITINTPPEEVMLLKFTTESSTNVFSPAFTVI
jgi:hypothetical protein